MPTSIASLGEFGLIKHLTKNNTVTQSQTILSVGDDAAISHYGSKVDILTTTDMLLEGVHFDLTYMPLAHLGYKSVAVNVSDICAMNGTPKQITISIGVSSKFSVENLEEFYEGVYAACKEYGVDLIGGDTCASLTGMCISVTCIGEVAKGKAVLRSTAKENDLICVTGNLGAAYMGFKLLEREQRVFDRIQDEDFVPDFAGYEYLIERQLVPKAQKDLRALLEGLEVHPTSMIDISDGLSSELIHIAEKSNKGIKVYEDKIPIDYQTISLCEEMNMNPITAAFNGGEDYEILFTVPIEEQARIQNVPGISLIGYVTSDPADRYLVAKDGTLIKLEAQGWNAANYLSDEVEVELEGEQEFD